MKARIKENRYGNWYGYLGTRRVESFFNDSQGSQEDHAKEWLARQNAPTSEPDGSPLGTRYTLPTEPEVIAFNTGRLYTELGQRIGAMITHDGGLLFVDIDRCIDGFIAKDKLLPGFRLTPRDVLNAYDYQDKDWSSNFESHRRPDEMKRLREAARSK